MRLYRFSPIESEETLLKAVEYVAKEVSKMMFRNYGDLYEIRYLTIFSHYREEYDSTIKFLNGMGQVEAANNGKRVILKKPLSIKTMTLEINGEQEDQIVNLKMIRIRKPDPYRMQVGCCDLVISSKDEYSFELTKTDSDDGAREIVRPDMSMIEFYDPDFDVLAYIVKP